MAKESIILEGKSLDELIKVGLERLERTEDQVEIEVLEKGRTIAGINIKKYKIKIKDLSIDTSNSSSNREDKLEVFENEDIKQNFSKTLSKFQIIYKEDGVYLSIQPISEIGVNLKDVLEKIDRKKIENVDYTKVEETVKSLIETCVKIAPQQEEIMIDSKVEVEISKDKMNAYMTIYPADGGKEYNKKEVIENVSQEIKFGLDESIVERYVDQKRYGTKELVAQGLKAIDGKDGYIEYKFESRKEKSPYILENGSVDFRKLNLIVNVNKGDVLAKLYPPEEGRDGTNVLGEVLTHKPGSEKKFNYGTNIDISDDQTQLISNIDGQICIENGKVIVYELYTVSKDVDNSTGDIEFNGNIKINGNVLTGFTVIAKGNIEIDGVVEGATIKCGGDLFIKRGIQGYNVANIKADGNIFARYIENAKVTCGKDIESEAIMHSDTICVGSIIVGGKKGLLVGGVCKASEKIDAKVIGSHMATATLLEVGVDPTVRENQEYLKTTKKNTEKDIDKFNKIINHLTKLNKKESLSPEKRDMLDKSMIAKIQLEERITSLNTEIEMIDEKIKKSSNGKINVSESIYSGVRIIIGSSKMLIQEKKDHCTIYRDEGEIKVGAFAN